MPLDFQLLTISTTSTNYRPKDLSWSEGLATTTNISFLQVSVTASQDQYMNTMAHQQMSSRSESELWFSLPTASRRRQEREEPNQEQSRGPEQSAYQATSSRNSIYPSNSGSPPRIPTISTADVNKPLPPSPSESEKKKRKSASWRTLIQRQHSSQLNPNHLQPSPYSRRQANLSVDTFQHHAYSRSMPNSPFDYARTADSSNYGARASSAAGYYPDQTQYQPYMSPQAQYSRSSPPRQQRSVSSDTYIEQSPPRARTFPESASMTSPSAITRESVSSRPRPHTWLSPTEPFTDVSQFHLFAEAMTGLPDDSGSFSPSGTPQIQGSLFARRSNNDTIPLPLQSSMASNTYTERRTDWYNLEPPAFNTRSVSAPISTLPQIEHYQQWQPPPQMSALNAELEMLGLDGDEAPDDELPDYAQSQAEMNARKRAEASARARELEARWRGARG